MLSLRWTGVFVAVAAVGVLLADISPAQTSGADPNSPNAPVAATRLTMVQFKVDFRVIERRGDLLYCAYDILGLEREHQLFVFDSAAALVSTQPSNVQDFRPIFDEWRNQSDLYASLITTGDIAYPSTSIITPNDSIFEPYWQYQNTDWTIRPYRSHGLRADGTTSAELIERNEMFVLKSTNGSEISEVVLNFDDPVFRSAEEIGTIRVDPRFFDQETYTNRLNNRSKVFFHQGFPCVYNYPRDQLYVLDASAPQGYRQWTVNALLAQHPHGTYPTESVVDCGICSRGPDILVLTAFDTTQTLDGFRLGEATRLWSLNPLDEQGDSLEVFNGPAVFGPLQVQMEYFDGRVCILDYDSMRLTVLDPTVR